MAHARRISTATLVFQPRQGRASYWGSYTRYRNGKRIYGVPYGVVWQQAK